MAFPRVVLLMLLVGATPALAGCNWSDWYNQRGTVEIYVAPDPPTGTALDQFRKLSVAIHSASMRQLNTVDPKEFAFADPLVIDLVDAGKNGKAIPIATHKTNLRATDQVTVRVEVVEAVDAAGKSLPACHPGEPVESRPCVSTPRNGAYRFDSRTFSPPRGGVVQFYFPLGVQYSASTNEYFIQADPAKARIEPS